MKSEIGLGLLKLIDEFKKENIETFLDYLHLHAVLEGYVRVVEINIREKLKKHPTDVQKQLKETRFKIRQMIFQSMDYQQEDL